VAIHVHQDVVWLDVPERHTHRDTKLNVLIPTRKKDRWRKREWNKTKNTSQRGRLGERMKE
jgi:hypothetical protein